MEKKSHMYILLCAVSIALTGFGDIFDDCGTICCCGTALQLPYYHLVSEN